MADRYWVGGAGSWNSTSFWSTSSGGASGASVPTSADNAIFNASSGGGVHYTVTVTDNSTCANLTFTPVAVDGVTEFSLGIGFVIAGTFSTSGTAGNRRAWFRSSTLGLLRDMQIATIGTVTDVDFRDVRVTGAGGTLSGTRIGDLRGNLNITASTTKIVYWNLAGAQNWSANAWATTSAGTPSTDNFPLAQDTSTFTNAGSVTGTITMNAAIPYTGAVDMSGRTSAMTLATTAFAIYGNWTNGSGTTLSGTAALTYSGRNTQAITSAGKTFTQALTVNSYGGTVELADALNIGSSDITITNGTFDTKNYSVTAGNLSSTNSNVRTITLGSSTLTLGGTVTFTTSTNLTLNAGTSSIVLSASSPTFEGGSQTFYAVSFTSTSTAAGSDINGTNTFQNLSFPSPSTGKSRYTFSANQTVTGTLTCAGSSVIGRIFLRSDTVGTPRTFTVATLSANDCDFRDITIAGAAAGGSPTRAGDCGGNTGITFPVAKTVYWNLAGVQNWSATAWAPGSGGVPAVNNFPLAQDTAVYDNTGSAGTITINAGWNIGTFDASARTSAMTLTTSTNTTIASYGNWTFGTGITQTSSTGTITFAGQVTQTITSNGVTFGCPVTIDCGAGTVQLADALTLATGRGFTLTSGTFDAVSYNVTADAFTSTATTATLKMGSGTWTLTGIGAVWSMSTSLLTLYKGTANIVLSNTTTTARTFTGNSYSYNKLTIGGATGISILTITGNNQFTELASTKTVAHTIALGTTTQTFGAWTVTGTVGNVVTVTGTATLTIAGARVSGVDYLAMGTIGFVATSPGEFYAGVNSSGTGTGVILTAAPSATTRYWVGGAGTWDAATTTNWSTSSGGVTGASVPTSADAVVFDTLSNATAYTVTCTATQLRCAALTFAGPLVGNVTWAGTAPLAIHGNFTLPATGLTRTYSGVITYSGSSTGRTITTNGVALASVTTVDGVGCGWTLASALDIGSGSITVTNGSFATSTFNFTATSSFAANNSNSRTVNFGSSTISTGNNISLGTTENERAAFTFSAGTSQINMTGTGSTFSGNNQTFYNVSTTNVGQVSLTLNGVNTFNNLSFAGRTTAGIAVISVSGNQTISGTLTLSAGTDATMRNFVRSDTIGTTRTLTCAAFAGTDADFRDITVAGAAAPASGTRLGDGKGNSGITFGAGATKYWNLAAGGNWGGAIGWATSSGGSPAINNFPLAQDTCLFEATGLNSAATVTVNASYNIGTIDMSARTSNLMTLVVGTTTPSIYGNWVNGTGTSSTGTGTLTFAGRASQTFTSAGITLTFGVTVDSPSGSLTLQDAFSISRTLTLTSGTFNANTYNATLGLGFSSSNSNVRTLAVGSGTWTSTGTGTSAWTTSTSTNLTVTGTGTISLTSASSKTFAGGGASYAGITLDQGGAGTLTITGNNTFYNISNSYKATGATTINMGATTQTVGSFTASGEVGRVLTVQGTSSTSPCTLVYSGAGQATTATTDYLTLTGVRAYLLTTTWYAGANSTNNGSLGWLFEATPAATSSIYYGSTNVTSIFYGSTPVTAIYYGSAQVF